MRRKMFLQLTAPAHMELALERIKEIVFQSDEKAIGCCPQLIAADFLSIPYIYPALAVEDELNGWGNIHIIFARPGIDLA